VRKFLWIAGRPSLDLCNTGAGGADRLSQPEDLRRWLLESTLSRSPVAVTEDDLAATRRLRDGLRAALLAGDLHAIAALTTDWLGEAPGRLCVDLDTLSTRFAPDRLTCRCVLVPAVLDALELARDLPGRVRECAAEPCDLLYLDTSRNRSRRWCSMERCGARSKAAAYYWRRRA
jgi:predicted RNA-binding Zn ribbon-like protein